MLAAAIFPVISLAQTETPAPAPAEKPQGVLVRLLCTQSLSGEEEQVTFATKTQDDKWIEHGETDIRSPFITEWIKLPPGILHLIRKKKDVVTSLGSFTIPEKQARTIIVLLPDMKKKIYHAQLIDPSKLGFQKGKVLVINYGNVQASIKMGKTMMTANPGQQIVEKIDADADGMYRLVIAYQDKDKKLVPCYDHFLSSNPQTRKFILLFPDQNTGLRAMNLSEFGPFE